MTQTTITTTSKPWYTSKTIWLNVISAILAIVGALQTSIPITPTIASAFAGTVTVLNIVLRLLSGAPITGTPAATPNA